MEGSSLAVLAVTKSLNAFALGICKDFARLYVVTFIPKRTVCTEFGFPSNKHDRLLFANYPVHWSDSVAHLGNVISNKQPDADDCSDKISAFNGYVRALIG